MNRRISRRHESGMSLVELMVAMVIALIGVVVIFQVYAVNEGIRRSTSSGSDEQTSGLIALSLLERELRQAGFGFNDTALLGCPLQIYDNQRTPNMAAPPYPPLAPVSITSNAGTTPDVIQVIYGQPTRVSASVQLFTDMSTPTDTITLKNRFGFNNGDLLVIGQSGSNCTLIEVSSQPNQLDIAHANTGIVAPDGTRPARFNNPAGTPIAYQYLAQARVADLGPLPIVGTWPAMNQWTVVNNLPGDLTNNYKLEMTNLLAQNAQFNPMADQIVHLKAEYGMDDGAPSAPPTVPARVVAANDNIIDKYTAISPTTPAGWAQVKVVRLAIVSRSTNTVDPTGGKGTPCDATPDYDPSLNVATYPVRWARGPDAPLGKPIDVRTSADWRCYKYKVYETTVPLRNVLWRQP